MQHDHVAAEVGYAISFSRNGEAQFLYVGHQRGEDLSGMSRRGALTGAALGACCASFENTHAKRSGDPRNGIVYN